MLILAGLGNPGGRYSKNRHNVGFMVVDALAEAFGVGFTKKKFRAETAQTRNILLVKPQAFMNLSGEVLAGLLRFYRVDKSKLLVFHDEIDLPFLTCRVSNSGAAGHRGAEDIIRHIGREVWRVRIGVGRPEGPIPVADYVLSDFSSEEARQLASFLPKLLETVKSCCEEDEIEVEGLKKALNGLKAGN